MSVHKHLPEGRLKRFEQWIERHEVKLLRWGFIAMFVVSVSAGFLAWQATQANTERIDQSCTTDEREHADNVRQLEQTYNALSSPTIRANLGPGLVTLIVSQMAELEKDARTDQAPPFCDEPGVGLPEPDPEPPERMDFSHLLAPSNSP
jgi:hypothetical protein